MVGSWGPYDEGDRPLKALALSPFVGQKLTSFLMKPNAEGLQDLTSLIQELPLAARGG
jgi:hypothetical protein